MFFGTHSKLPSIEDVHVTCNGTEVEATATYKYLGVILDSKLTFSQHIENIKTKAVPKINSLERISYYVNKDTILYLYKSLVLSQIEYADIVYDGLSKKDSKFLQRIQNKALKSILHLDARTPTSIVHEIAEIDTLEERRRQHVCTQVNKGFHDLSRNRINGLFESVCTENDRHQGSNKE